MSDVDAVLRRVAALGLEQASRGPVPEVADDALPGLIARARQDGLVGLLDQAVAVGQVRLSESGVEAIGTAAVDVAAWCLFVERHALVVHDRLDRAGLDHRFLKGFTIAHRFEDHPALRPFADVDVLVRGEDIDAVAALLVDDGHHRVQPEWRPGYVARWGKSVTLRSGDGIEVDLHRTFASGPYGVTGDPQALWDRPAGSVGLGGDDLPCLDLPSTFVHAGVHAVTGQAARMASLRDIAVLAGRPDLDLDVVAEIETALGVAPCMTEAVRRAWAALGLDPSTVSARFTDRTLRRRDRRWLDLYRRDASFRRMAVEAVVAVPGTRAKAEYLGSLSPRRAATRRAPGQQP